MSIRESLRHSQYLKTRAVEMAMTGKSFPSIAKELGVSTSSVYQWYRSAGGAPRGRQTSSLIPHTNEIQAMAGNGASVRQLAKYWSVNLKTMHRFLVRNGIKTKGRIPKVRPPKPVRGAPLT